MPNHERYAEEMIVRWLEYCNLWAAHQEPGDSSALLNRDYVTNYRSFQHPMDIGDIVDDGDDFLIVLHAAVADELGHVEMIGVFTAEWDEDGGPTGAATLDYLTVCVDTMWRDVWSADPNAGFLNKP